MKTIKEYINVNESKTDLKRIEEYGKSWTCEWEPSFFGNILTSFVKGMKKGLEENQKYIKDEDKQHFMDKCMEFTDELLENINKKIY